MSLVLAAKRACAARASVACTPCNVVLLPLWLCREFALAELERLRGAVDESDRKNGLLLEMLGEREEEMEELRGELEDVKVRTSIPQAIMSCPGLRCERG